MPVRQIVKIDEEKCDGCGLCIPACEEGALRIVDGKARLVSDVYCDGLGACLGTCPQGAIALEERQAEPFDVRAAEEHAARPQPTQEREAAPAGGGCPGSMARRLAAGRGGPGAAQADEAQTTPSELQNWPLQLHLVPPGAPFLQGADLLVAADCVGFAHPDLHRKLLRGKALVIACPKLDDTRGYVEKLAAIIRQGGVRSVEVAHMEVPCCAGLRRLVEQALHEAGTPVPLTATVVGMDGAVQRQSPVASAPTE